MFDQESEDFLAIRKEAAQHIDPETAEVSWYYVMTVDPYGVCSNLPEEYRQVERGYFARNPGSAIWVSFNDLPDAITTALWTKHKLAFPDGLEELFGIPKM